MSINGLDMRLIVYEERGLDLNIKYRQTNHFYALGLSTYFHVDTIYVHIFDTNTRPTDQQKQ